MSMDLSGFVHKRKVIKIGSKDFTFSELTIADLAEWEAEMKRQRDAANEKRRKRIMGYDLKMEPEKLLAIIDKPMTEEELEAEMETIAGMGLLAFYSLTKANPEISKEQAAKIVTIQSLEEITAFLFPEKAKVKKKPKAKKPLAGERHSR